MTYCDKKECDGATFGPEWCDSELPVAPHYTCCRRAGHEGPHIACGGYEHDLAVWTDAIVGGVHTSEVLKLKPKPEPETE